MLGELAVPVFDHDDRGVDEHADREGEAAKGHDVRADVEVVHGDEGSDHGDGQRKNRNQRRTEVKQENDDDHADDDRFFDQVALQSFDGRLNESGPIISGDNFNPCRQRRFGLRDFSLHSIDDIQRIHAVAHYDDTGDGLSFALPLRSTFSNIRAEDDRAQIANSHRSSVLCRDRHRFKIAERAQITQAADHIFRPAHLQDSSAGFIRAGSDFFDDCGKRNAVGAKLVRIDIHLVLLDKAADGCDFRDARNRFELIPEIPVLDAAQLSEAALMGAIQENIFVHPACAGGVGSDDGMGVGRQSTFNLLHVLENARPCPVEVGSIFKHHEDVGVAEHSLRAHRLDVRRGK